MITTNIINRTFHIKANNSFGTAFSIEVNDDQYLISAKHVVESILFHNGDSIEIEMFHDDIGSGKKPGD